MLRTVIHDIVNTRNGHLNTGILGTKHLWPVLVNAGHGDVAYTVATQTTYPSYGYWLEKGATTLWEKWSGEHSHNHQMFGSVEEFFYKHLAGIRPPGEEGTSRGYRRIRVRPFVPEGLEEVEAFLETVAGPIESHWRRQPNSFRLEVQLPANTTGQISIPGLGLEDIVITEGRKVVWESGNYVSGRPGIDSASRDSDYVTFSVGSGRYVFRLTGGNSS